MIIYNTLWNYVISIKVLIGLNIFLMRCYTIMKSDEIELLCKSDKDWPQVKVFL